MVSPPDVPPKTMLPSMIPAAWIVIAVPSGRAVLVPESSSSVGDGSVAVTLKVIGAAYAAAGRAETGGDDECRHAGCRIVDGQRGRVGRGTILA
jgi:hypothetical protein